MSTDLRSLRSERVLSDAYALAQSRTRLDRVLREQQEATAVLVAAQRAVDDLAREASQQRDLTNTLAARLEDIRADMLHLCVATLPDDVLRCVFEAFVSDGAAAGPFIVAAVCGRWRRIALRSPAVWSTIHVTAKLDALKPHDTRLKTLLSRSVPTPLHIEVKLDGYGLPRPLNPDNRTAAVNLLSALGLHVSRWKTASFTLDRDIDVVTSMECLKGPTPVLSELSINTLISHSCEDRQTEGFFPFAPLLRKLRLYGVALACSSSSEFPVLSSLRVSGSGHTLPLGYISPSCESLHSLGIGFSEFGVPDTMLELPKLKHLDFNLLSKPMSSRLHAPKLTHLTLPLGLDTNVIRLLDAVSPTVRVLAIYDEVTIDNIAILEHLRNVEKPKLLRRTWFEEAALQLLVERSPIIWPRLTTVDSWPPDTGNRWPVEAILRFISSRNAPDPPGHGSPVSGTPCPSKLRNVTFSGEPPHWFVAEVERLLKL